MARIAFLGLGQMGAPMARHLIAAGHQLTVWNRTADRASLLAAEAAAVGSKRRPLTVVTSRCPALREPG